jgi:hypothetical protein
MEQIENETKYGRGDMGKEIKEEWRIMEGARERCHRRFSWFLNPTQKGNKGLGLKKNWICVQEISFIPHGRGTIFHLNLNLDILSIQTQISDPKNVWRH